MRELDIYFYMMFIVLTALLVMTDSRRTCRLAVELAALGLTLGTGSLN